jgi:hypothetical protein
MTESTPESHAPLYEALECRRKYPRIVIDHPARLRTAEGDIINASVYDISPDGVQVRCDRDGAAKVHPSGRFIKAGEGPRLEMELDLPFAAGPRRLHALCKAFYIAVISHELIAFGLRFRKFVGDGASVLESFVAEAMEPVNTRILGFLDNPRSHEQIAEHMGMPAPQVVEVLNSLREGGEILSFREREETRHVRSSCAMQTVLDRLDDLEDRLAALEQARDKK